MAAYTNFRSSSQIEVERNELREARQKVLDKAQEDYERSERRREKAKQAGEGTWMLDSVSSRIDKEQKEMEKLKKKKKKKEKKKKKKKDKKKKRQSSSSDSDSDDSGEEPSWVEKSAQPSPSVKPMTGPTLQRDSWMEGPMDFLPTVTRKELREKKKTEEERRREEVSRLLEQPGQHARELNPFWKDGGFGLPKEKAVTAASRGAGDGGLSWLLKALDRCKQQAKDEGRSLDDVASERYGSLEKLQDMIREAERANGKGQGQRFHDDSRPSWRSRSPSDRDRRDDSRRNRDRDGNTREREGSRERDRNRERDRDRGQSEYQRRDRDGKGGSSDRDRFSEKRRFARPKDDSDEDGEPRQKSRSFMKPGDERGGSRVASSSTLKGRDSSTAAGSSSSFRGRFAKPAGSDEEGDSYSQPKRVEQSKDQRGLSGSGWRKAGAADRKPTGEELDSNQRGRRPDKDDGKCRRRSNSSSSHSGSAAASSSSSSGSESDDGEKETPKEPEAAPVKLLSEDEMNSLGAKILRAEIMGDETLAQQLKDQLEQARKAKAAAPKSQGVKDAGTKVDDEDKVVVLTRTGKDGMVRPLPEQEFDHDQGRKKRRKKKNVETHEKGGERSRYFDDDDKHDLKTLVQMEKLGTAEDQNSMFARLAGKSTEQTNDDFQVDDMFVSRAAQQQSGSRNEEKERSKAIFEHRKISAAMDKCQFCFNNIPKHLIIAIGTKVYLCLPAHRSLTPGHCLIVPMQHTASATVLDEDVWQEIQTFRKQLVQMFAADDQDVVFMETSMRLKYFPHMVVECIPLDREIGDLAPIYFKKALQDAGPEWNSNKKVVDLSKKNIRHSVPKGFPYFSVDFGLQGGYAHVIEEENTFPSYFGREIVGGMIDAEPTLWRKPHREGFEDQRQKVLEFEKMWRPFDITAS